MEINTLFIDKWQGLIGAALGPFLAVIFSLLGFFLKNWWDKRKERRDTLRQIEIVVSQSLNDVYAVRAQLKQFVVSVRKLVTDVRAETDPKTFSLERTNFPFIREVYRYVEVSRFKVRSYYLHNMLLFVDAGIREMNGILTSLRNDFQDLLAHNENQVNLMLQKSPNPPMQRKAFAENLETFAQAVENYANGHLTEGIVMMVRIKVFNDLLRKRYGFWIWWKIEGTKYKYFRTKADRDKFARTLGSIDRIDAIIQDQVQKMLDEAEEEEQKRNQKKSPQ